MKPKHFISLILLGMGVFLLVQVIMPLVSFQIWELTSYKDNVVLVSPVSAAKSIPGISIKNQDNFPAIYSNNISKRPLPYEEFTLSVPSLNLDQLRVKVESNNFDQSLAHLPGTALPGERGNVFVTGHSSLPQLFRPGNFKAIFAHLPEVKKGEEIILDAGGQRFRYIIEGMMVVNPSETWVINPPDQEGRYLSLMTCVPPGFYLKRLIILARLSQ